MAISEEYLIKFKGDTSGLNSKINGTSKKVDRLKSKVTGIGGALKGLAPAIGAVVIIAKLKSVANHMDLVGKSARRLGVATEELSALAHAAQLSGVEFGSLAKGIQTMQRTTTFANEGLVTYARSFERAGIVMKDLEGLNTEEQFIKIASAVAGMDDSAKRTTTALEIFGRAGGGIITMAENGSEALAAMTQEARDLGVAFDAKAAKSAENLNDTFTRMNAKIDSLFMKLAENGSIDVFVEGLITLGEALGDVTTLYGDMLRQFGVTFNGGDLIKKLAEETSVELVKAKENLVALQGEGFGGFMNELLLNEEALKKNTEEAIKEIERLEGALKNLNESYDPITGKAIETEGEEKEEIDKPKPQTATTEALKEQADFQKQIEGLVKSLRTEEEVRLQIINDINKAKEQNILNEEQHKDAIGRVNERYKDVDSSINDIGGDLVDAFSAGEDAAQKFGDLALKILGDIITKSFESGGALDGIFSGGGGGSKKGGGGDAGGGILSGIGSFIGDFIPSFDGGGGTGNGVRSGGLDGKGGFLSMMHPQEDVIDRTKGGGGGGSGVVVNQVVNNQLTGDAQIERKFNQLSPILKKETMAGVLVALQAGGDFTKAAGGRQ